MVEKVAKNLNLAVAWAAAEFKYVQELINELEVIEKERDPEKEKKEVRRAIICLRYVSLAERRAATFEEKVKEDLEKIYGNLSLCLGDHHDFVKNHYNLFEEIRKILKELEIEHNVLVEYASRYEGLLSQELTMAEAEIQLLADIASSHDEQKAAAVNRELQRLLTKITNQVKQIETWIEGLQASLIKAKQIFAMTNGREGSSSQELLKGPYLGKIDSFEKGEFGVIYYFRTRLGVKTRVFIPDHTIQDLSLKTLANFGQIFEKVTRRVFGGVWGVVYKPVKFPSSFSFTGSVPSYKYKPLFVEPGTEKKLYALAGSDFMVKGRWSNSFEIDGVRYHAKVEVKNENIIHAINNLRLCKEMIASSPKHFDLIYPPYLFAVDRGKGKCNGVVVTEYREMINHNIKKLDHSKIELVRQEFFSFLITLSPGFHDYEQKMLFIRRYNPATDKVVLSFLDQVN